MWACALKVILLFSVGKSKGEMSIIISYLQSVYCTFVSIDFASTQTIMCW